MTRITLTSIPPRFALLGPTLESLVAQELPAPVELWIPQHYRRFPNWDGALPKVPSGVEIRRCDQDWGPATKVVPAILEARAEGDSERDILLCDDDSLYATDWHKRFSALRAERPTEALAAIGRHLPGLLNPAGPRADGRPRMRRLPRWMTKPVIEEQYRTKEFSPVPLVRDSGYADLFGGWGGVMVRPSFFPPALLDGPGDCWPVDDVWLSAMLALAGVSIWVENSILPPTRRAESGAKAALTTLEVEGKGREALDLGCIERQRALHGIWTPEALGLLAPDP